MRKQILLLLSLLLLTPTFAAQAQIFGNPQQQQQPQDEATVQLQKFDRFFQLLTTNFFDSIPYPQLIETAIRGVLAELDPHSVYLSAREMQTQNEQFAGNFSGIGVEFNVLNDTLIIVNTVPGGPSETVGILPNDRIVIIDGENVVGISREEAPRRLRGPRGSQVMLGVVRHGAGELLEFRIVRDNIPITTVDAAYNIDSRTGYVRVNRFAQTTMTEFREAVQRMGAIDGLVLDLRGNGGGYLGQAIEMSNFFLDRGDMIVSTEGMRIRGQEHRAVRNGEFRRGRVVVLMDEFSASASEIVAGALQDWDRAVIVGRRSFGKGLVQSQFPMQDGSAIRITVAQYLTPTGRAIQRPFEMGHSDEYHQALAERIAAGEDISAADGTQPAFRTLRFGRTVYGGGGIFPDYFVPADTEGHSEYLARLIRMGIISEYLVEFLDRNRTALEARYPTFEAFDGEFSVGQEMIDRIVAMGERRGVALDQEGLAISREFIATQVKALIAGRLWTNTEFYRVVNPRRDPVYRKAVEIMTEWNAMAAGIATDR